MSTISFSAKEAERCLRALDGWVRLARIEGKLNGTGIPPDVADLVRKLHAAASGAVLGTTVDTPAEPVRPSTEEVDVATAAARLGIKPRAVRKQIARGKLSGRKVGGVWLVEWRGTNAGTGAEPVLPA